jgi:glutamine---fructose-6-phosphate transaminase (isomerizing)
MRSMLARLPSLVEGVLRGPSEMKGPSPIGSAAEALSAADRCVVLGRGFNLSTAFEWALKLQELCYVAALPFSTADFEHGPAALAEPGLPVLAVVPEGPLHADAHTLLARLRAERDVDLVAVSDRPETLALGRGIPLPDGVPEWASPIVAAGVTQMFCFQATLLRGLDPDAPRGLRKVTRTR